MIYKSLDLLLYPEKGKSGILSIGYKDIEYR